MANVLKNLKSKKRKYEFKVSEPASVGDTSDILHKKKDLLKAEFPKQLESPRKPLATFIAKFKRPKKNVPESIDSKITKPKEGVFKLMHEDLTNEKNNTAILEKHNKNKIHKPISSETTELDQPSVEKTPLKLIHEGKLLDHDPSVVKNVKAKKLKRKKTKKNTLNLVEDAPPKTSDQQNKSNKRKVATLSKEEINERYPVLSNQELIQKFLSVQMTNNQKGRIRQVLKDVMKGTTSTVLPDVIHGRIQAILKSSDNLTDADLRKIRILFNMLRTATEACSNEKLQEAGDTIKAKKSKAVKDNESVTEKEPVKKEQKKVENKARGPKRYVVYVGNLPLGITKEEILTHFKDLRDMIKDVRMPFRSAEKKTAIAYVELKNEPAYELSLSKHHTMLGNRRINVLFTTQKGKKDSMTHAEVHGKSAKLSALVKSGHLIGSIPLNKKRSQRRAKMRRAQKLAEKAN